MSNICEFMNEAIFDADVLSVQHASTALDDGYVGELTGLVSGERDLYAIATATAVTTNEVVMVVGAEVHIDAFGFRTPVHNKATFTYIAGMPVRAYRMRVGMRFKINTSAISGTPVVGQYVIPANGTFTLASAATLAGGTRLAFVVEETGSTCNIFTGKTAIPATIIRVIKD